MRHHSCSLDRIRSILAAAPARGLLSNLTLAPRGERLCMTVNRQSLPASNHTIHSQPADCAGQIASTQIPYSPASVASDLARPVTLRLADAQGDRNGPPCISAVDDRFTIEPQRLGPISQCQVLEPAAARPSNSGIIDQHAGHNACFIQYVIKLHIHIGIATDSSCAVFQPMPAAAPVTSAY